MFTAKITIDGREKVYDEFFDVIHSFKKEFDVSIFSISEDNAKNCITIKLRKDKESSMIELLLHKYLGVNTYIFLQVYDDNIEKFNSYYNFIVENIKNKIVIKPPKLL